MRSEHLVAHCHAVSLFLAPSGGGATSGLCALKHELTRADSTCPTPPRTAAPEATRLPALRINCRGKLGLPQPLSTCGSDPQGTPPPAAAPAPSPRHSAAPKQGCLGTRPPDGKGRPPKASWHPTSHGPTQTTVATAALLLPRQHPSSRPGHPKHTPKGAEVGGVRHHTV